MLVFSKLTKKNLVSYELKYGVSTQFIVFNVFNFYVKPVLKLSKVLDELSVKSTYVNGWNVN